MYCISVKDVVFIWLPYTLTCSKKICLQLLYVINAMLQLVILNMFLGPEYKLWGYGILMDLLNNKMWRESGHFPRVTMCDFHVS